MLDRGPVLNPQRGLSRRVAVVALGAALLGYPGAASATSAPEAGRYTFEAFTSLPDDARLPPELRRGPEDALWSRARFFGEALLPTDRTIEIQWVARERVGFQAYRVTAAIEKGPLAGIAAQWSVDAGTGEAGSEPALRTYRLRLPLAMDRALRLRITLEACREDGSKAVLAVREVDDGSRGYDASDELSWRPHRPASRHSEAASLASVAPLLAAPATLPTPPLRAERAFVGTVALARRGGSGGQGRAPPALRDHGPTSGPMVERAQWNSIVARRGAGVARRIGRATDWVCPKAPCLTVGPGPSRMGYLSSLELWKGRCSPGLVRMPLIRHRRASVAGTPWPCSLDLGARRKTPGAGEGRAWMETQGD